MEPFSTEDIDLFSEIQKQTKKHHKTIHKSFDCSIMELADDISYGVHDLEDAISLKFITEDIWNEDVCGKLDGCDTEFQKSCINSRVIKDLFSDSSIKRKRVISDFIYYFIRNVEIKKQSIFESSLLDLKAQFSQTVQHELDILKKMVRKYVICNKNAQMMEYSGEQLIIKLFEAIYANSERMLPSDFYIKYIDNNKNLLVISDYISGMTDAHAIRIYQQIFSPDQGTMFRKI